MEKEQCIESAVLSPPNESGQLVGTVRSIIWPLDETLSQGYVSALGGRQDFGEVLKGRHGQCVSNPGKGVFHTPDATS